MKKWFRTTFKLLATRPWLVSSVVVMVAITATFFPAFRAGFCPWDDYAFIHQNPFVRGGIGSGDFLNGFTEAWENNWIPLTWTWFAGLVSLSPGEAPSASLFHIAGILIHVVNSLLLLGILRQLKLPALVSLVGVLLFALHPLRVETVLWIASQKHLLGTAFASAAFLFFLRPGKAALWASRVFFAVSLTAAQTAVALPLVCLLVVPLVNRKHVEVWFHLATALVLGCIPLLLNYGSGAETAPWYQKDLAERLLQAPASLAWHSAHMVWPSCLTPAYPWPEMIERWALVGMAILAVGAGLAWSLRAQRLFIGGVISALVLIAPVLGLIPLPNEFTADRFTYLPAMALAVAFSAIATRYSPTTMVGLLAVVVFMPIAFMTAQNWHDDEAIIDHTLACYPNSQTARINKAVLLERSGERAAALDLLVSVRKEQPLRVTAWTNELLLRIASGENQRAIEVAREAIRYLPDVADLHLQLGNANAASGDWQGALPSYRRAYELAPDSASAVIGLARALVRTGDAQGDAQRLINQLKAAGALPPDLAR